MPKAVDKRARRLRRILDGFTIDGVCRLCHRCQFSVWVYGVNRSDDTAERWAIDVIRNKTWCK